MSWQPEPSWEWPEEERQKAIRVARRLHAALPQILEKENRGSRSGAYSVQASPEDARFLYECFSSMPPSHHYAGWIWVRGVRLHMHTLRSTYQDHLLVHAAGQWTRLFLPEADGVDLELYERLRLDGLSPEDATQAALLLV